MPTVTAVLDACVLVPVSVTDLLLRLAAGGLFRARWTDEIHEEWMRALLAHRPDLSRAMLERRRDAMNRGAEECLVEGYQALIEGLVLPDPTDRHVLAAAVRSRADVIVTYNLRDFPREVLEPLRVDAQHPDPFVRDLLELDPAKVCAAVRGQRRALRNPPRSVQELLDSFRARGLVKTAEGLATFGDVIQV